MSDVQLPPHATLVRNFLAGHGQWEATLVDTRGNGQQGRHHGYRHHFGRGNTEGEALAAAVAAFPA